MFYILFILFDAEFGKYAAPPVNPFFGQKLSPRLGLKKIITDEKEIKNHDQHGKKKCAWSIEWKTTISLFKRTGPHYEIKQCNIHILIDLSKK